MAWRIVRIEPAENEGRAERDRLPVVGFTAKRCRLGVPSWSEYADQAAAIGFEIALPLSRCPKDEWPFTAYSYVSPNRNGVGRVASGFHRYACKRKVKR